MNRYSLLAILLTLVASCAAQDNHWTNHKDQVCAASNLTAVEHRDGVTVETLTFTEITPGDDDNSPRNSDGTFIKKAPVNAHVYVPDGVGPFHVLLFSHSAIHSSNGTTDLLPYAFALARSRAASIVLDRAIQWDNYYDRAANIDHLVMECASLWLKDHLNGGVKSVGTLGEYYAPQWVFKLPVTTHPGDRKKNGEGHTGAVGFATSEGGAEFKNNELIQTIDGQLKLANNFILLKADLQPIQREWLSVETKPDKPEVAKN
jgi:hypothetical protein